MPECAARPSRATRLPSGIPFPARTGKILNPARIGNPANLRFLADRVAGFSRGGPSLKSARRPDLLAGMPHFENDLAESDLADSASALRAFHEGGGFLYPFRHGYEALGALLDAMPPNAWRDDEAVLGGLVLYLVKQGQTARAKSYLRAADLGFEKTDLFDLLDLLLALHMGEPVSETNLTAWRRLERSLPLTEPLLLGLYYNAMMAMSVRLGHLAEARVAGQQAISCYREASHVYLEHFIHIHLADLDVLEGRLHHAERGLTAAERCLVQAGVTYANERELIGVTRLAIAYERGDLERVRREADGLRTSLLNGDSWSELFYQLARIAILSAYFLEGREAARRELDVYHADYARRHGGVACSVEALAARIWQLDWHPNEAERALDLVRGTPMQSALGDMVRSELEAAMGLAPPVAPQTPRGAIVAELQKAQRTRGNARRTAIEAALRLAMDEWQIAPFLEHRDVFLGVSAKLANSPFARRNRKYAALVAQVLRRVDRSYVVPERLSEIGFNRRQYRVASALQSGATNKQIALQLGASEATVKYHLTSIYRLTGRRRRSELIDFMYEIEDIQKS